MADRTLTLNAAQKREILRQYKLLRKPSMKKREYGGAGYTQRDDFQRDYSRVLYSPAFRRLQGKMQIMGINSSAFYRNRLTHSLEVSQIATSIARLIAKSCGQEGKMYSEDIHLIEAAALAHDIGHPAFGHKGERVLDKLGGKLGIHFEGNAHNFKVLRTLETKEPGHKGLNLTNRTLLAINKYIVREGNGAKKFMFSSDYDYLDSVRKKQGLENVRTLDVQIIEIADDIAYAVHDLEDGLALRNFSINEILFLLGQKNDDVRALMGHIVGNADKYAKKKVVANVQDYSKLFRMRLTSQLTDLFVHDITIADVSQKEAEVHGTGVCQELKLNKYGNLLGYLKDVIFECTTREDDIHLYESRGEVVLTRLFELFSDPIKNENGKFLPQDFRPSGKYSEEMPDKDKYLKELAQNSIDYIAGMMDTFAISEYERLFNEHFDEIVVDRQ